MVRGRATGKTWQCLQWLNQHPDGVMVCHSMAEVDRLKREARRLGLQIDSRQFVSANRLEVLRGRQNVSLCVDNLDIILPHLLGAPVDMITATGVNL
jgi:hypothetical protein